MQRARETCELAGLGEEPWWSTPDLVEWNYGEYEGQTTKEIHEVAPGWLIFRDGCPGGETPEQVGARVDRVIARSRAVDRRHRTVRARTRAARVRGALDRIARERRSALSAGYGHLVRARLLPRNTGCADLERASPRRGRVMIGQSESSGVRKVWLRSSSVAPPWVSCWAHERFRRVHSVEMCCYDRRRSMQSDSNASAATSTTPSFLTSTA